MKEIMDVYNHTLDLARFTGRKAQPLHRQLKKLYRKNKYFQSHNKKLKAEMQHLQYEMAQRNLEVLIESSIEQEKPTAKESVVLVKNPTTAKGKHVVLPKGSPPSTRIRVLNQKI
jgi:hypothetical protein